MPHKIKQVLPTSVKFEPPQGKEQPPGSLPPEKFGVTDKALGLVVGNEFEKGVPNNFITKFAPDLAPDTGDRPDIDRNPYNFVALAGKEPWTRALRPGDVPPGHDIFQECNGVLEFEAETRTPCFVPAGFPFSERDDASADDLRTIARHFCQMVNAEQEKRFAIPGASFKGALRSAVEAIANARFGVADRGKPNKPGALAIPHLYRRRVFGVGILDGQRANGDWDVEVIKFLPDGTGPTTFENRLGLLAQFRRGKDQSRQGHLQREIRVLPKKLAEDYAKFVGEHPHYQKHRDNASKTEPSKQFYSAVPTGWRGDLATLLVDQILYFTCDPASGVITNFGKNVNYLWPAACSILDLAEPHFPRRSPMLDQKTDLAEYLFGFVGGDEKAEVGEDPLGQSVRGRLRFETLWGPRTSEQSTTTIQLAPLTSPSTPGKSRPLYLAHPDRPGETRAESSSFDDPGCEIRGRKFYWHQRHQDGSQVWAKHTFAGAPMSQDAELRKEVRRQCPPPLEALPAGVKFRGRIHFSNLTLADLGAILFALEGDGSFDHAFHLGKAKPRGMGSFKLRVTNLTSWLVSDRYSSLTQVKGRANLLPKRSVLLSQFQNWLAIKAGLPTKPSLRDHPHLLDFIKLHTWPAKSSIRYYPVNFNQYSWLPADDDARGEPRGFQGRGDPKARPPAMKRARDLQP